jgi:hypothetical protein
MPVRIPAIDGSEEIARIFHSWGEQIRSTDRKLCREVLSGCHEVL